MKCLNIFSSDFGEKYMSAMNRLSLSDSQKEIINDRYISIVTCAELEYKLNCALYFILTSIITLASVLLTAFISFDIVSGVPGAKMFWALWVLSLSLTLANKVLYSFNINKRYILAIAILEKFRSEGWTFAAGTGRYSAIFDLDARYRLFMDRVERIKIKSIESISEGDTQDSSSAGILATGSHGAMTPSATQSATPSTRESRSNSIDV